MSKKLKNLFLKKKTGFISLKLPGLIISLPKTNLWNTCAMTLHLYLFCLSLAARELILGLTCNSLPPLSVSERRGKEERNCRRRPFIFYPGGDGGGGWAFQHSQSECQVTCKWPSKRRSLIDSKRVEEVGGARWGAAAELLVSMGTRSGRHQVSEISRRWPQYIKISYTER